MPSEKLDEKAIFNVARQIDSPIARLDYVRHVCGPDTEMLERVEVLLQAYHEQASFLESPPGGLGTPTLDQPPMEKAGSLIGPYKLLQEIGVGGMGVVFLAEQHEPVRRRVALKIIKPGMDSAQVLARFEAERQALSLMDHPNIAKVLDAGTTDLGRPYFVMELVKGQPITQYCDQHQLTPRRRLELLLPVCHAIQHAHQKGVIHRDIKPSNILVAEYDQQAVPKIIDFGVAKAVSQSLTEKTMFTAFGQVVGTLEYMSPEQAKVNQLDIDTRSDVYSLGVLLYELLTGSTPFDKERLRSAAWDEMLRIIREEEPPKPSTRLSDSRESLPSISAMRLTEPAKLTRLVRGELDWIVMKALEKDRNRRYETINGLALDVQRYLADEPVQACPPSALYRLHKLVRRNKGAVVAAAIILLALLAGVVGTAWQAKRAQQAQAEEARRAEGEQRAKERAEANFAMAKDAVETYLGTITNDPDLKQSDFSQLRKKLLESAIPFFQKLTVGNSDDPEVEAGRGWAFLQLALLQASMGEHLEATKSLEAMQAIFGQLVTEYPAVPRHRQMLAESHYRLSIVQREQEKLPEAEASNRQALAILKKLETSIPNELAYRVSMADCHNQMGILASLLGNDVEAETEYRNAMDRHAKLAADFPAQPIYRHSLAGVQSNLSVVLQNNGNFTEAESLCRQALAIEEKLAASFPENSSHQQELARHYHNLSVLLNNQGRHEEAEAILRQALIVAEPLARTFKSIPVHRTQLLNVYMGLGVALSFQQKHLEAETAFREAVAISEQLADNFPDVPEHRRLAADCHSSLGNAMTEQGKSADAESAYRRALDIHEQLFSESPNVVDNAIGLGASYCNFGMLIRGGGDAEESLGWFDKAIATLDPVAVNEARNVNRDEFLRNSYCGRADAFEFLGRYSEAVPDWEKALECDLRLAGSQAKALRWKLSVSRIRTAQANQDAAGCLAASVELESLNRGDDIGLYETGCYRAICAALVIPDDPKTLTPGSEQIAQEQADLAMEWLRKAVAAGYHDVENMRRDPDLDALRERDDFKSLLAELEMKSPMSPNNPQPPKQDP